MSTNDLVRIKYWYQPEDGQGYFTTTGLIPRGRAEQQAKYLPQAEIVEAEEYEH